MSLLKGLFPNTWGLGDEILEEVKDAIDSCRKLIAEGADVGRCMRHDKATFDRLKYRLGTVWASNIHVEGGQNESSL
jgi:hypothetical protein